MLENLNPKLYTVLHPTWAACALQPPSLPTQSYTLGQPMRYSPPHSLHSPTPWGSLCATAPLTPPPQPASLPGHIGLGLLQPWLSQLQPIHHPHITPRLTVAATAMAQPATAKPPHSHHAAPHCRCYSHGSVSYGQATHHIHTTPRLTAAATWPGSSAPAAPAPTQPQPAPTTRRATYTARPQAVAPRHHGCSSPGCSRGRPRAQHAVGPLQPGAAPGCPRGAPRAPCCTHTRAAGPPGWSWRRRL